MTRFTVPIMILIAGIPLVAVAIQAARISSLTREVDWLKREIKELPPPPSPETPAATPVPDKIDRASGETEKRMGPFQPKENSSMTRLILDPANLPEGMEAFIRETAREEIQQEIQRREKKAKLNRKPLLKKLVEELELDPATEYQVAEAVNMAKDESFRLFKLNRTDGGNFVDDFAGALRSPNRDEEAKRVWVRLLSEKIPGSDETFVARYEQMKAGVNDTIKSLLFEEQWKAYQGLVMDPVQIQTGHTPWQDYFKSQGLEWPEDW